jgi:sugar phosphate isomerase/epimerase
MRRHIPTQELKAMNPTNRDDRFPTRRHVLRAAGIVAPLRYALQGHLRLQGKPGVVEVEVGRGVLDIRGMLKALLQIQYAHHVGFEHERTADDPLPGIAESVGYTKATLAWAAAAA